MQVNGNSLYILCNFSVDLKLLKYIYIHIHIYIFKRQLKDVSMNSLPATIIWGLPSARNM